MPRPPTGENTFDANPETCWTRLYLVLSTNVFAPYILRAEERLDVFVPDVTVTTKNLHRQGERLQDRSVEKHDDHGQR